MKVLIVCFCVAMFFVCVDSGPWEFCSFMCCECLDHDAMVTVTSDVGTLPGSHVPIRICTYLG